MSLLDAYFRIVDERDELKAWAQEIIDDSKCRRCRALAAYRKEQTDD